jgi:hypothetical protein
LTSFHIFMGSNISFGSRGQYDVRLGLLFVLFIAIACYAVGWALRWAINRTVTSVFDNFRRT